MEGGLRLEGGEEETSPKVKTPLSPWKPTREACFSGVEDPRVGAQEMLLEVWCGVCWGQTDSGFPTCQQSNPEQAPGIPEPPFPPWEEVNETPCVELK